MATAFTDLEKERIKERLLESASVCLGKYGVKKTTVDQLVQMAGISKGAFYQFFSSKEILFFHVLENFQNELIEAVIESGEEKEEFNAEIFTELIYQIYQKVRYSFLMNIIQSGELEVLMRKLPEEEIERHHSFDEIVAKKLLASFHVREQHVNITVASLRAIFLSMLHVKEIGVQQYDQVLKTLIKGVAIQLEDSGER